MFSFWLFSLLIVSNCPPSEIDALIQQLGSPKFTERQAATKRLEAIGQPAAEALRRAAATSPDAEIRRRSEGLLATMKWQEIVAGKDSRARQRAVLGLGQLGPRDANAQALLQKAIQDKDLSVRWRAAYALWQTDPRRSQEAIKVLQGVSEAWQTRLPDLPALQAAEETEALLSATLEIVEGKIKPRS